MQLFYTQVAAKCAPIAVVNLIFKPLPWLNSGKLVQLGGSGKKYGGTRVKKGSMSPDLILGICGSSMRWTFT